MNQVLDRGWARRRLPRLPRVSRVASAALLCCSMVTMAASGQSPVLKSDTADESGVYLSAGAEYGFVATLGYERSIGSARPLMFFGSLTVPWAAFDMRDYKSRVGVRIALTRNDKWNAGAFVAGVVRGSTSEYSRMTGIGADVGLTGGRFTGKWSFGAEAAFDWSAAVHVRHSDTYRSRVFADARDGWYRSPGSNLRAGLFVSRSIGSATVFLRAGQLRDGRGAPQLLPFYAVLGVRVGRDL